jgi:hypothetical protein
VNVLGISFEKTQQTTTPVQLLFKNKRRERAIESLKRPKNNKNKYENNKN